MLNQHREPIEEFHGKSTFHSQRCNVLGVEGRTRYATGYWAEEFAKPYKIISDAGHEVVVATPNGVTPNVDMMSLRVMGFTNEEEEGVGLASKATWLLETELKEKIGVDFSSGEIWKPYMVEDRNLVTGQNPASAAVLAKRMLEVLAERASRKPRRAAGAAVHSV